MNRIARIAIVAALFAVVTPSIVTAQADPSSISNQWRGAVSVIQGTNGVKWLYLPDGSYVNVNSLGTNSGPVTVTTISGTTGTFTTGAIGTVNATTVNATAGTLNGLTVTNASILYGTIKGSTITNPTKIFVNGVAGLNTNIAFSIAGGGTNSLSISNGIVVGTAVVTP